MSARRTLLSALMVLAVTTFVPTGGAAIVTLTDANASAQLDPTSQAGMFNWFVDGANQLNQQWFWYRVGSAGGESSIDTISAPAVVQPDAHTVSATYTNTNYNVRIDYLLRGGAVGSGVSDIGETITINNTSGTVLPFHFYQYTDFNLSAVDTVQLGKNISGKFNEALQTGIPGSISETVVAGGADHGEAAFFPTTRNELNDALPTTLNDAAGPVGPGDVTWAFEWDLSIPVNGTVIISKDKNLSVPEPSVLGIIGLAVVPLVYRRKR